MIFHTLGELVFVFESIHQARLKPLFRVYRRLIDQTFNGVGTQIALGADRGDDLIVQAASQAFVLFFLRLREILVGEHVGGALVLARRGEIRRDPHPVERAAHEQLAQLYAHQVEVALRHQ